MPEVDVMLRWPGGERQHLVSPSRTITGAVMAGAAYPVDEFARRATVALEAGSERVRQRYGFACSAAAATAAEVQRRAACAPSGQVLVEAVSVRGQEHRAPATAHPRIDGHVPAVVVGGGQAGLSASWYLREAGIDHLVLERSRAFSEWRDHRWDAFCLVTPNWQCRLPGHPYDGDDPDGFMVKSELLEWLERFEAKLDPPLIEGVSVTSVAPLDGGGFEVKSSAGIVTTDHVVLAVGGYHVPVIPAIGRGLPESVTQLHSADYRNPDVLPDGAVLVVGSGQSGAQIAEDLHLAGRQVHLAVGEAPRVARTHRGRDVVAWLHEMGHYDLTIDAHPEADSARQEANHYVTGRDGGRDIDLRRFAAEGMRLHGRLETIVGDELRFRGDLAARLDSADATYGRINAAIDAYLEREGIEAPAGAPYEPCWHPPSDGPTRASVTDDEITTVIWSTGFRKDWSWVHADWLGDDGWPRHERGVTELPGLFVLGLPWLHTWGSGRFASIDRDARYLVSALSAARATAGQR